MAWPPIFPPEKPKPTTTTASTTTANTTESAQSSSAAADNTTDSSTNAGTTTTRYLKNGYTVFLSVYELYIDTGNRMLISVFFRHKIHYFKRQK